jgi:hypothetical protein
MFLRVTLSILGTLFLTLGILGLFLPLVPTTPFLLLASACYLRGSSTLHNWLITHKHLGPYISNIKDKKAMPLRAKIFTIALLWPSLLFSMYRVNSLLVTLVLLAIGCGVTAFILRLRTLKED